MMLTGLSRPSPITPSVDFDAMGVQHGHLRLPYSRDDSAWGSVMIPVAVIRGGEGPTALLTGGNHGDEYEGPIALFDLALTLRPEEVTVSIRFREPQGCRSMVSKVCRASALRSSGTKSR